MKKILGAIAGALLLGTGCAHEQAKPSDTGMSAPSRVSTASSSQGNGLSCAVIGSRSSGSTRSTTSQGTSDQGTAVGQAAGSGAIGSSPSQIGTSENTGIGGSSNQAGTSEATGIGSAPSQTTPKKAPKSRAASKPDNFEDTGMGGAGGGGG